MEFAFDALQYRYPSRRSLVYARNGMVCASQPLAAQAGIEILHRGGNAVDAVIAAAACLTVLEPMSDPLGGDAFSILWHDGRLYGLNASGPAPKRLTVDALRKAGYEQMPVRGWGAVTVPGMISGWREMHDRFGRLPLRETLAPAVWYAEHGYAVTPVISEIWRTAVSALKKELSPEFFRTFSDCFAPDGKAPSAGSVVRLPDMAETLRQIGETDGEAFYRGDIAEKLSAYAEKTGGYLRQDDLKKYQAEWVDPVMTEYHGYDVWELPPNGHGIVVLMALNILKEMDLSGGRANPDVVHRQIEALKLAFTDGKRFIADPSSMKAKLRVLLSDKYAAERRALIGPEALLPKPGNPYSGDTVYLNAADSEGNMISWIQSGFKPFGSGIVVPGTGICLQDRGNNFSMDPQRENCVAPGKKPYHTIIPGFLTKDGKPVGPFGIMGGFMQPQAHVQVLMNLIDFGMNPQEALDAPRWMWTGGRKITIEPGYGIAMTSALLRRGHEVHVAAAETDMGRGQIILRDDAGTLCGASEPRADGQAAAF